MAEDSKSPRPGLGGFLDDLLADLRKKTITALSLAVLAGLGVIGSGLLAALAFGVVSLSEQTVWILYGVVGTVVLHAVVLLLVRAYLRSRRDRPVVVVEDDKSQAIERLREAYEPCMRPVRYAYEFVERDICSSPASREGVNDLLVRLIERFALPECRATIDAVESAIRERHTSRAHRDALIERFNAVLYGVYPQLIWIILFVGSRILGVEMFDSPRHIELRRMHVMMLDELKRAKSRTDICGIAGLMGHLECLQLVPLPKPSTGPRPTTASGQAPPSSPESSG